MRHGLTIVPAGLVLVVALLGAGGDPEKPAASAVAWLDDRFGMQVAPIYLALRPDVQLDLKLSQWQIASAEDEVRRLVQRLFALKNKTGEAALAAKRAIDEEMATWLRTELTEDQFHRIDQISLQWEGASALRRPTVAEFLVMDKPQQLKTKHLLAERDRRYAAGELAPGEFDKLSREVLDMLTSLQKMRWHDLLGPPCRFSIGRPAPAPGRRPQADAGLKGRTLPPGR
jgi:hypothetical protein